MPGTGAPKREGEMLTASRERGVIGCREIDAQRRGPPEDRGQEALGLTQRYVEDETERQGGFDGEIGILELPAPPADASRCPRGDRVRRERQSASACMRPRAGTASRPWSRSARASANASATSATASPAGCVFVTTTGPTIWRTTFQRVTSPRRTRARSYSAQFPTRYVVLYFGCTLDFTSRS